jgi:hypothetical protein
MITELMLSIHHRSNMGNVASYFRSTPTVQPRRKDRLAEHLAKLNAYDTKQLLLNVLKNDPRARARCILLDDSTTNTEKVTSALTDEDVENLYEDVEIAICECRAEEVYLEAVIDLMVNQVKESGGGGMVRTLHRMLWLAWGMNNGRSCFLNAHPRSLPPVHMQEKFIQAIEELDNIGKKCGYVWSLNDEGRYNLGILIAKDDIYYRIRHLDNYKSRNVDLESRYKD